MFNALSIEVLTTNLRPSTSFAQLLIYITFIRPSFDKLRSA
ncbi:hypothetical protein A2U01_0111453, partial [Trifolium medium]|nr:hypothetical protein [Trifolium medium]